MDRLDSLLLHCMQKRSWPADMRPVMDALHDAKAKGLVRAVGFSSHGIDPLEAAAESNWPDLQLSRINPFGSCMDAAPDKLSPRCPAAQGPRRRAGRDWHEDLRRRRQHRRRRTGPSRCGSCSPWVASIASPSVLRSPSRSTRSSSRSRPRPSPRSSPSTRPSRRARTQAKEPADEAIVSADVACWSDDRLPGLVLPRRRLADVARRRPPKRRIGGRLARRIAPAMGPRAAADDVGVAERVAAALRRLLRAGGRRQAAAAGLAQRRQRDGLRDRKRRRAMAILQRRAGPLAPVGVEGESLFRLRRRLALLPRLARRQVALEIRAWRPDDRPRATAPGQQSADLLLAGPRRPGRWPTARSMPRRASGPRWASSLSPLDARTGSSAGGMPMCSYLEKVRLDHNIFRPSGLSPQGYLLVDGEQVAGAQRPLHARRARSRHGETATTTSRISQRRLPRDDSGNLLYVGRDGVLDLRTGREVNSRWAAPGKDAPGPEQYSKADLFEATCYPYKFFPGCTARSALAGDIAYDLVEGALPGLRRWGTPSSSEYRVGRSRRHASKPYALGPAVALETAHGVGGEAAGRLGDHPRRRPALRADGPNAHGRGPAWAGGGRAKLAWKQPLDGHRRRTARRRRQALRRDAGGPHRLLRHGAWASQGLPARRSRRWRPPPRRSPGRGNPQGRAAPREGYCLLLGLRQEGLAEQLLLSRN